ncbi:MAG TPA: ABC transporter ATP-binding protein [Gemmatimonadales bacterium]|nr:ABC transporter ATP-binding protein [Gemmatimonadales bacterium]
MTGCDVRVTAVRFAYGEREALRGIDLAIGAGERVALVGPNGAGKTTLTRLLVALRRPTAGRVTVGDWDVATRRPDEMARRVGYVFQHADQQLFARTVADDVAFGPRCLGRGRAGVAAVLDELGLGDAGDLHPYDVPAPARKLVALAGVLAMEPAVLILDEPTAGLDRVQRSRVVAALGRRAEAGVTVLAVSHDLGFVAEAADRIVAMREGRIAADLDARELLYDRAALGGLGLRPPAVVEVSDALGLAGRPVRFAEAVEAMRGITWREQISE